MSKGPGTIERRIAELFATSRDRPVSVSTIADHAFLLDGKPASRAQRLSATRAAHRLLRRIKETDEAVGKLVGQAHAATRAKVGADSKEYKAALEADPAWLRSRRLKKGFLEPFELWRWGRFGREGDSYFHVGTEYWRATLDAKGNLYFHAPDAPVRLWAVSVQPAGVIWADAEVTSITDRFVGVLYNGERGRLDRAALWQWWAFWRGVRFVSNKSGRIAARLDEEWQERYGHAAGGVPPVMQMPLARAMELLGVEPDYDRDAVIAAFRKAAKKAHPDVGGTAELFRLLVEARDRLLASIGTSAPAPKMPAFYPKGVRAVYRVGRSSRQQRLGSTRRLARA